MRMKLLINTSFNTNISVLLTEHRTMKACWGVEV